LIKRRWRIEGDVEPWPGPMWEPHIFDGAYPPVHAVGDLYINSISGRDPIYYVFVAIGVCEIVKREDIDKWIQSGLMKASQLDL